MQFDSMAALLAMDGHGIYVWSVYALVLVVLAILVARPLRQNRRFFVEEAMRYRRQQAEHERQLETSSVPHLDGINNQN